MPVSAPKHEPREPRLLEIRDPGALVGVRYRRVGGGGVVVQKRPGRRSPGLFVAAAVAVRGGGVFHAVVVHEVGGVVVGVEVSVAPVTSLPGGFHQVGCRRRRPRAVPNVAIVALISRRERALVPLRALVLLEGRFAVAECGAQVVAAGVSVWSFADEAVDPT